MLKLAGFWEAEKSAPLMMLNRGFLEQHGFDAVLERVSKWPSLVLDENELNANDDFSSDAKVELSPEVERIIIKDAERTFSEESHRKKLAQFLSIIHYNFKDYHQGLSFATSFLLLFLPENITLKVLTKLNKDPKYIPGYWRHEAVDFARDAYVFNHLLKERLPDVYEHLAKNHILPETFCQKWFVALCIHVLPFDALFEFFEQFLKNGNRFLLQFGLSLMQHLRDQILATTDAATIFALLRLDSKMVHIDPQIPMSIVQKAKEHDLSHLTEPELEKLRKQVYEANLKGRFEALERKRQEEQRKAQADESEEDDEEEEEEEEEEGIDCQVCNNMMPEYYCKSCGKLMCGLCHAAKKPPHVGHKVVSATQEIIDKVMDELAKLKIENGSDD